MRRPRFREHPPLFVKPPHPGRAEPGPAWGGAGVGKRQPAVGTDNALASSRQCRPCFLCGFCCRGRPGAWAETSRGYLASTSGLSGASGRGPHQAPAPLENASSSGRGRHGERNAARRPARVRSSSSGPGLKLTYDQFALVKLSPAALRPRAEFHFKPRRISAGVRVVFVLSPGNSQTSIHFWNKCGVP